MLRDPRGFNACTRAERLFWDRAVDRPVGRAPARASPCLLCVASPFRAPAPGATGRFEPARPGGGRGLHPPCLPAHARRRQHPHPEPPPGATGPSVLTPPAGPVLPGVL